MFFTAYDLKGQVHDCRTSENCKFKSQVQYLRFSFVPCYLLTWKIMCRVTENKFFVKYDCQREKFYCKGCTVKPV